MSRDPTPFLFVVGCPRSGTTLLQRMLDHHPDLAVANDTHFVARAIEKLAPEWVGPAQAGEDVPLTDALREGLPSYHRFGRLGVSRDRVADALAEADGYRDLVARLYGEFARSRGKRFAGEKTPDFVRRLPLLHGLFPAARVLHIVRDGRDVALSLLDWANQDRGPGKIPLWREQPVAVSALWWRWQVRAGRDERPAATPYAEVRYESLVADPERELQSIAWFLDLPYAEAMARFHRGKERRGAGLSAKSAWLPATRGLRDWRKSMDERDVALFEALAGDLLDELGLERGCGTIPGDVRRTARECEVWWGRWLERRRRKFERRLAPACEARS